MKTKFRKLEKLWGNVKDKIKEDAQHLHKKFSALVNSFFFYIVAAPLITVCQ